MARYPDRDIIYAAARDWLNHCVVEEGSVRSPGRRLWTDENVAALHRAFVENLLEGSESFLDKFRLQLAEEPAEVKQLAAEMLWVMCLFPSPRNLTPASKRELVTTVWNWSDEMIPPDHAMLGAVLEVGIGNPGQAYNQQRWRELTYFINLVPAIRRVRPVDLVTDPWAFAEVADGVEGADRRQFRHILLHLLFPDTFERIATRRQKEQIVEAFAELLEDDDPPIRRLGLRGLDRALLQVRHRLEAKFGTYIDFHDVQPIRAQWDPSLSERQADGGPDEDEEEPAPPKRALGLQVRRSLWYAKRVAELNEGTDPVELLAALLAESRQRDARGTAAVLDTFLSEQSGVGLDGMFRRVGVPQLPPLDDGALPDGEAWLRELPFLARVADMAKAVAAVVAEEEEPREVSGRHLLAALLVPGSEHSVEPDLQALGGDVGGLRAAMLRFIQGTVEGEDPDRWADLLGVDAADAREPPLAGYVSDAIAREDRLGVARDVEALASVLAAHDARPPLSVGLFGDWGTGKTFFMELLEARIRELARVGREARAAGRQTAFCTHVVQIWFNAWHYIDANLWASLATRVFEGLSEYLETEEVRPDEKKLLFDRLAESRGILTEVQAQRVEAEEEKQRIQERVTELETARDEARRDFRQVLAVTAQVAREEAAESPEVRRSVARAARELGISEEVLLTQIPEKARELKTLSARLWAAVRKMWSGEAPVWRLALVAAVVLLPVAAVLLLNRLTDSGALKVLAGLAAPLIPVAAGLAKWYPRVTDAFRRLRDASAAIERHEDEKYRQREAELRRELAERDAAVQQAREAERAADDRVRQVEREIDELRSGRRLQRFIQERSGAAEYREHLGIIHLIRKDFQQLDLLLKGAEASGPEPGLPHIDRIILYIDDLDRCPEHKVVEVLQAVHLLLAFKLFVVVVGVDSRWLLLSLQDHYAALRGRAGQDGPAREDERAEWSSTPQNYLEKIFQIPFTLRSMEAGGFGRLMGSLVTVNTPPAPETGAAPLSPPPPEDTAAPPGDEPPPEDSGTDEVEEMQERLLERVDAARAAGRQAARANPPSLAVEPWEMDFIHRLHGFIATPRAAKRFMNVYRFLRAQVAPAELDAFRGTAEKPGEYQVVALLLAILVGFPADAVTIFQRLLKSDGVGSWDQLFAGLCVSSDPAGGTDIVKPTRLCWALKDIRQAFAFADQMEPFTRWAPQIARFSFQSGRILESRRE